MFLTEMFCSKRIETGNREDAFVSNGVTCKGETGHKTWRNAYEPCYNVTDGECHGYIDVNDTIPCTIEGFNNMEVRRLCRCVASGIFPPLSTIQIFS